METKKPKTRKKTKYIFSYEIAKIKRQNLFFSVTYCEAGSLETYTDVLRWSEIKKPSKNIVVLKMEVLKMEVLKKENKVLTLNQKNSKKLLNILDMYNNTGLFYNEIKPTKAPTEKEIVFCISLYFAIAPKFSKEQISYKFYLNEIVNTRQYLLKIQNPKEREVFMCFLSEQKSKLQISKELTNHTKKGVYLIDKNLQLLIYEIMQDYKNGFLQVKEYQKPKTQREKTHQANEYLKEIGSPHRIPLREPSQREILSKWEKYKNEIDQKATKTSQKA